MKLMIAGGGTGGHIFPAIGVAEEFVRSYADSGVIFIGTEAGLEREIIPRQGYRLMTLNLGGIRGKNFQEGVKSLICAAVAFVECIRILKQEKPDAVLGVGGYASGPMLLAAWLSRFVTAIHEQNTIPGLTNRVLGRFVDRIFITFRQAEAFFPQDKIILSGNPVRKEILTGYPVSKESDKFTILVLGGSQGASALNRVFSEMASGLVEIKDKVRIIHQAGKAELNQVQDAYRNAGVVADVRDFIIDMRWAYSQADVVVARAGASTLAELSALGKPAILVPYPYAAGNHQMMNALVFKDAGAAELIDESALNPEMLLGRIRAMMESPSVLKIMSQRAKSLFINDAGRRIVEGIMELTMGRS